MPSLRSTIHHLATTFAAGVVKALRNASLDDILAETSGSAGGPTTKRGPGRPPGSSSKKRLARRSAADLAGVSDSIIALVKKHGAGLRAEQIRAELQIAKNEWMGPLALALASKKLTKKGAKRSTTYFAR